MLSYTPARRFRKFPSWKTSRRYVEIIHERIDQKHFCPVCNIHDIIDRSFHNVCFMRIVYDSLPKLVHPSHNSIATICIINRLRYYNKEKRCSEALEADLNLYFVTDNHD